jgi:hypothetical protein
LNGASDFPGTYFVTTMEKQRPSAATTAQPQAMKAAQSAAEAPDTTPDVFDMSKRQRQENLVLPIVIISDGLSFSAIKASSTSAKVRQSGNGGPGHSITLIQASGEGSRSPPAVLGLKPPKQISRAHLTQAQRADSTELSRACGRRRWCTCALNHAERRPFTRAKRNTLTI